MNILVTGGAGFIGSHVVEHHLDQGDEVVAVDDLSTGNLANIAEFENRPRFRFVAADIAEWDGLAGAVHVADRVYHLAAVVGMFRVLREPVRVTRVNVCATERLLEAVAAAPLHPQVVIASSSSVYSHTRSRDLREDDELVYLPRQGGLTGYALSKLTNEIQAMAYRQEHGLQVTIPRLFNAVGPRQTGNYGFVLPRFIRQALSGEPLTVFGDGTQTRSFCDVRDTVAAVELLAGNPAAAGQPVNVGNERETRIIDLARLVIERAGSSSTIQFVPFAEAYGAEFDQITQRHPVEERLHSLTGFHPHWNPEQTPHDLIERARAAQERRAA
ncbi:MAG: NAD-dependent epimerase/dehydratase family protein [Flavobacteriales bacterium]